MSYRFGCKVLLPASRKFSIYARPSFEWNPNNVIAADQTISQKRSLIGLDLGLTRSF